VKLAASPTSDFTLMLSTGRFVHLAAVGEVEIHEIPWTACFVKVRVAARAELHETCLVVPFPSRS